MEWLLPHERDGEGAVTQGEQALAGERHSLPSLLMGSRELVALIQTRHPMGDAGESYLGHLCDLAQPALA